MRTKSLFFAALAATALVSCSDDLQFVENASNKQDLNGKMVKAGMLAIGRDGVSEETRSLTNLGKFLWMPELDGNDKVAVDADTKEKKYVKVGLCWTGANTVNPEYSSTPSDPSNVFTNYEFYHVGWLENNAGAPDYEDCEENTLRNGAFIEGEGNPVAYHQFNNTGKRETKYQQTVTGYDAMTQGKYTRIGDGKEANLNLKKGVFMTKNASVYEGQYLAYFPYNPSFTRGPIIAKEPVEFTIDMGDDAYAASSETAFSVGLIPHYNGGSVASKLESHIFSGWLSLTVQHKASGTMSGAKIKKVVFYAPTKDKGIIYEAPLNSAQMISDLTSFNGFSETPYVDSENDILRKNSIFINTTDGKKKYWEVPNNDRAAKLQVAVPVLPQDIADLKIVLIADDDKSYMVPATKSSVKSNKAAANTIYVEDIVWSDTYMVVDEQSMVDAFQNIWNRGAKSTKTPAPGVATVQLLNDIDLYHDHTPYTDVKGLYFRNDINVTSECGAKLTLKSTKKNATEVTVASFDNKAKLSCNIDIVVEGWECCGFDAAKLLIGAGGNSTSGMADTLAVELKNVVNRGLLALGNRADDNNDIKNNITVTGQILNQAWQVDKNGNPVTPRNYNVEYKAGTSWPKAVMPNEAVVYLLGSESDIQIETLDNYGSVITSAGQIKLAVNADETFVQGDPANDTGVTRAAWNTANITTLEPSDVQNGTSKNDFQKSKTTIKNLTNYRSIVINEMTDVVVSGGIFNNKHDDGLSYTYCGKTYTPGFTGALKYDAQVPTATIKIEGQGNSTTSDGHLNAAYNGATLCENTGVIANNGMLNFGKVLDNKALVIDMLNGQLGDKFVVNVAAPKKAKFTYGEVTYETDLAAAIYVSQVNTTKRMTFAMEDEVDSPSSNIIEILGIEDGVSAYALNELAVKTKDFAILAEKDVIINSPDKRIVFANTNNAQTESAAKALCIGHCVTVVNTGTNNLFGIRKAGLYDSYYTTNHVTALAGTQVAISGILNIGKDQVKPMGNLNVLGNVYSNQGGVLTVNNDLNIGKYVDVMGEEFVETAGTFTAGKNYTIHNNANIYGTLDSNSEENSIEGNMTLFDDEKANTKLGKATFIINSRTIIDKNFHAEANTYFEREQLGSDKTSRATVNVKGTVSHADTETASGSAWPTEVNPDGVTPRD